MQLNSYVSFTRKFKVDGIPYDLREFGKVIALRTAKYGRWKQFFSVQSKSGVYSSVDISNINEVNDKEIKYSDLRSRRRKKGIKYKLARKARLVQARKDKAAAKKASVQTVSEASPVKGKKRK